MQTVRHLARMLRLRQRGEPRHPYHLLLTSTLSLTPQVRRQICGNASWTDFRRYMHQLGYVDRLLALQPLEQNDQHSAGYQSLARLILNGHFSTILTTNIDSSLEQALEAAIRAEKANPFIYKTLVVDRHKDDYIVQAFEERDQGIQIVKLHGSLHDRVVPESFPDFFEVRQALRESIMRYLQQDIIIVGSLEQDLDILRALSMYNRQSGTYYVLDHPPASDDQLISLLEARGKRAEEYTIAGDAGDFTTFFHTLEMYLSNDSSGPSETRTTTGVAEIKSKVSSGIDLKADIMLVTVTDEETKAVFAVAKEMLGIDYQSRAFKNQTYYDLGLINDARVVLVRSTMGSGGPDGSMLTVSEGINTLQPAAIIMVGIAFGLQQRKQQLGDILVAQKLRSYEQQRYGTSKDGLHTPVIIPRGDLVPASPMLLDRFESASLQWSGATVRFGTMLSGEKLIDNKDLRDQLLKLEPEAIGGEMEGEGLYSVAYRYHLHWLLVKAICDWADGNKGHNKDRRQRLAARNAAKFTLYTLQSTSLI